MCIQAHTRMHPYAHVYNITSAYKPAYIYTHVSKRMQTCLHLYAHLYASAYKHACIHTHMYTSTYQHACTHTHNIYKCIKTCKHPYTHVYKSIQTCMHPYTYIHVDKHIHACMHAYTCLCMHTHMLVMKHFIYIFAKIKYACVCVKWCVFDLYILACFSVSPMRITWMFTWRSMRCLWPWTLEVTVVRLGFTFWVCDSWCISFFLFCLKWVFFHLLCLKRSLWIIL